MPKDALTLPFDPDLLREERERAGLTRPGLAARCLASGHHVTPQHIGRLERGLHTPQAPLLKAFADVLGVPIDRLLSSKAGV
ncbi:helix-turn-helix domain-containing protein [Amycolatopsis palatopharyngis]|uniref:helix-turn-helix domain-containing protein n=1 Tax=Amycolatopsis palatopharyngis TaxID=187982 RepID=UPI000E27D2AE|nr:helix-turn-helix transcriptional regulator [Amycolatopsis palatopharyngis]